MLCKWCLHDVYMMCAWCLMSMCRFLTKFVGFFGVQQAWCTHDVWQWNQLTWCKYDVWYADVWHVFCMLRAWCAHVVCRGSYWHDVCMVSVEYDVHMTHDSGTNWHDVCMLSVCYEMCMACACCCLLTRETMNDVNVMCGMRMYDMSFACCVHDVRMLCAWVCQIWGVGTHKKNAWCWHVV